MLYAFIFVMGLVAGAVCVFLLVSEMRRQLKAKKAHLETQAKKARATHEGLKSKQQTLAERAAEIESQARGLEAQQEEFASKAVSYQELQGENAMLKRDLQNVDVSLRKLDLDAESREQAQQALDERAQGVAGRHLKDSIKWIGSSLTTGNFVTSKQRLQEVIKRCRSIGFAITAEEESNYVADLKAEFEKMVRAAFEREEQARIKAQIRDEQKLEREIQRELQQLERERAAIQASLEKALKEARDEHSEEVERLKARLAEAEQKSERAISRAQMTKSGHVYVISNIGSFGEGVYKVGMTRRLEPNDRVRELGDASVPFPFDVHMMISSDDAPTLENALHRALHKTRLNKIKPRKEFFRSNLDGILKIVRDNHGEIQYVADPEALEYRQSISMSEEDQEFIEHVYDELEEDKQAGSTED